MDIEVESWNSPIFHGCVVFQTPSLPFDKLRSLKVGYVVEKS